jgi:hypothetical protein
MFGGDERYNGDLGREIDPYRDLGRRHAVIGGGLFEAATCTTAPGRASVAGCGSTLTRRDAAGTTGPGVTARGGLAPPTPPERVGRRPREPLPLRAGTRGGCASILPLPPSSAPVCKMRW